MIIEQWMVKKKAIKLLQRSYLSIKKNKTQRWYFEGILPKWGGGLGILGGLADPPKLHLDRYLPHYAI